MAKKEKQSPKSIRLNAETVKAYEKKADKLTKLHGVKFYSHSLMKSKLEEIHKEKI